MLCLGGGGVVVVLVVLVELLVVWCCGGRAVVVWCCIEVIWGWWSLELFVSGALFFRGVVSFGVGVVVETSARGLCSASSMQCLRGVVGKGGLPGSKGVLDPDLKGY